MVTTHNKYIFIWRKNVIGAAVRVGTSTRLRGRRTARSVRCAATTRANRGRIPRTGTRTITTVEVVAEL